MDLEYFGVTSQRFEFLTLKVVQRIGADHNDEENRYPSIH